MHRRFDIWEESGVTICCYAPYEVNLGERATRIAGNEAVASGEVS
jgi:hypothetical protein